MFPQFVNMFFAGVIVVAAFYMFAYVFVFILDYPARKQWKFSVGEYQIEFAKRKEPVKFIDVFIVNLLGMAALMIYCSYMTGGGFTADSMVQTILMAMGLAIGERDQMNRCVA
jgi:hypothetical protein